MMAPDVLYVLFVNGKLHSTHHSEWEARGSLADCRGYWEVDTKRVTIAKYTFSETLVEG